jgi:hypothetical protein
MLLYRCSQGEFSKIVFALEKDSCEDYSSAGVKFKFTSAYIDQDVTATHFEKHSNSMVTVQKSFAWAKISEFAPILFYFCNGNAKGSWRGHISSGNSAKTSCRWWYELEHEQGTIRPTCLTSWMFWAKQYERSFIVQHYAQTECLADLELAW